MQCFGKMEAEGRLIQSVCVCVWAIQGSFFQRIWTWPLGVRNMLPGGHGQG